MRLIELTRGKFAMVDDEDYEAVNQFSWFAEPCGKYWYAARNLPGPGQRRDWMHRFILNAAIENMGDHKNGNGLDNQRHNLRECLRIHNQRNRRKQVNPTSSPFKGVSWHKKLGKWVAYIGTNNSRKFLGVFLYQDDAALAYDAAARDIHGEFACLNFPTGKESGCQRE